MKITVNVSTLKWKVFKDLFYEKYFTSETRALKVTEFLELKQGGIAINEYILKFEEGCQFVPFIAQTDAERGAHFIRGLKAEIKRDVRISKVTTYQEIVVKAIMDEKFMAIKSSNSFKYKLRPKNKAKHREKDMIKPLKKL